ncbi:MAG TPA: allantoinase AllB [Tepidisphaeraceae bacterium]|nr:allantoinase AllB [Tepidisphaeraceae bacterium]
MNHDLLIRNGHLVTPSGVHRADVAVADGKVVEFASQIAGSAREEIDATGLHVFPGLIDIHVHFNDPGRADWEGFDTGSAALAAGGGTCFFDMPLNSSPPVIDAAAFDGKLTAATGRSYADFGLWGGIVPGNLDQMEALADRGVVGFKAFMSNSGIEDFPRTDDLTLYRAMRKAKQLDLPVAVHAESDTMTSMLAAEAMAAGHTSVAAYLDSRPIVAEVEAVERAIILAEETGCRLHIVHVSNSRSIEQVRRAAARGECDVTCETCPHYLALNRHDVERLGASAKCAPPLRTPAENDELWQDLAAGKIPIIASDHSPSPPGMKTDANFFKVWGGVAGVQSTLPILLSRGPALPLPLVAKVTAATPASRFRIAGKGKIEAGFDADFALVDVTGCFELKREQLLDRHKLSPYIGRCFHGVVRRTILRGMTIFQDGATVNAARGQLVKPQRRR